MAEELTKEQVQRVAQLAGLSLSAEEIGKFQKQLTKIFEFIDLVKKMETKGVLATERVGGNENVWREDQVNNSQVLSQEEALGQAKERYRGYFKIKAIF